MPDIHKLVLTDQGRVTADVGYLKFYLPLIYCHKNTLVYLVLVFRQYRLLILSRVILEKQYKPIYFSM